MYFSCYLTHSKYIMHITIIIAAVILGNENHLSKVTQELNDGRSQLLGQYFPSQQAASLGGVFSILFAFH